MATTSGSRIRRACPGHEQMEPGSPQPLLRTKSTTVQAWSFAPDGKWLAYFELDRGTEFHLWAVSLENDGSGLRAGQPEVFLQTSADERHPSFSPDGRWLAYSSTESGGFQVYVKAFPDKGGKWQISSAGGVPTEVVECGAPVVLRVPG